MGISGLTTFLDENPELLNDMRLHDCRLVIDGNNLYHFLYYFYKVDYRYGGDYNKFANCIKCFFDVFRQCNIESFVVFDGAYDKDDSKLETCLRRAKERLHLGGLLSYGKQARILPILADEVIKNVLDDLKIRHVTCDYEADTEIAALAKELNCPVLSNDSDFFIYDTPGGIVLLDYLNLRTYDRAPTDTQPAKHYLRVQHFCGGNFTKLYPNLDAQRLALFACLRGTDTFNARIFKPFLESSQLPSCLDSKFKGQKRFSQQVRLLLWLSKTHSLEQAVDDVTKIVRPSGGRHAAAARRLLLKAVQTYTDLHSNLAAGLLGNAGPAAPSPLANFSGSPLPGWFAAAARQGVLSPLIVNVAVLHRVILLAQVERLTEPSVYDATQRIRQVTYGVILKDEVGTPQGHVYVVSRRTQVEECRRNNRSLGRTLVPPMASLEEGGPELPGLAAVPGLSLADRISILRAAAGVTAASVTSPPALQLTVLAAAHWALQAEPVVNCAHLAAMLACVVKTYLLDPLLTPHEAPQCPLVDGYRTQTTQEQLRAAGRSLARFAGQPRHTRQDRFDGYIVHAYSQFQASLRDLMNLNSVLQRPLPHPHVDRLLIGTSFYNLYSELKIRPNPLLYVQELLVRDSPVSVLFKDLYDTVTSLAGPDCLPAADTARRPRRSPQKKRCTTSVTSQESDKSSTSGEEEVTSPTTEEFCTLDGYDISNRFTGLFSDTSQC